MAVDIVNKLNHFFKLHLPLNTCHTHVDIVSLSGAVLTELGMNKKVIIEAGPAKPLTVQLQEVVIVGQAFRLPGDINTPESFWQALVDKRDIMTPIPPDRWDQASFYRSPSSTAPPQTCDITFEKAGFIEVANFDNNFFGISAPEAFCVSPAIRLTLETAFEALENANIPISRVKGTNMGVFVAAGSDGSYQQLLFYDKGFEGAFQSFIRVFASKLIELLAYTRFFGSGVAPSTACGRLS
jgi:acyl transferase domain-containing protein